MYRDSALRQIRKPDFFIVGGPKCGTTSLQEYLAAHRHIFMCTPKEPCYFDKDIPYPTSPRDDTEYLKLFNDATEEHLAVGEASTNYLYSKVAVGNILEFNPDACFIVMVRNPIDMAASLHAQSVKTLDEDVLDFRAAWGLQDERREGRCLPRVCYQKDFILYGDFCRLGEQLERLYATVARDRVLVIVFDDLRDRPKETYQSALRFLGVPDDGRNDFPVLNPNLTHRSEIVRQLATRLLVLRNRIPVRKGFGLVRALIRLNNRVGVRPSIAPDFRRELSRYFRPDVEKLSVLTGRDLTVWVRLAEPTSGNSTAGQSSQYA